MLVAVAETGSHRAAARRLGQSQPTLGRHVAALEAALGGGILARHARGLALTERGQELYALARSVADAVQRAIAARLGVVEVLQAVPSLPSLPVWLVAYADLRRGACVRAVWDALHAGLAASYAVTATNPAAPPPAGSIA